MNVPVLIEKRSDGRVRVSGLGRGPLGWDAEGASLGEATASSSLDDFFGDLRDDSLYEEWQDAIAQYRQEREAA